MQTIKKISHIYINLLFAGIIHELCHVLNACGHSCDSIVIFLCECPFCFSLFIFSSTLFVVVWKIENDSFLLRGVETF